MTAKGEAISSIKVSGAQLSWLIEGLGLLHGYRIGDPDTENQVDCRNIQRLRKRLQRRQEKRQQGFSGEAHPHLDWTQDERGSER